MVEVYRADGLKLGQPFDLLFMGVTLVVLILVVLRWGLVGLFGASEEAAKACGGGGGSQTRSGPFR